MSVFLIGGGRGTNHESVWGEFARAADGPIACVILDEGDGLEQFEERWSPILAAVGRLSFPVLVPLGGRLDIGAFNSETLGTAAGVLVCGGLTPGYADAIVPVAADLRSWLADGDRAYAGFSAGAAIAARRALVGGWHLSGVPVCDADAGEDLDELTVVDGLGLVEATVDVHAAQWGTLARLIAAVSAGLVDGGWAIDEDTVVGPDGLVGGTGQVWQVRAVDSGSDGDSAAGSEGGSAVSVRRFPAGTVLQF